MDEDKTPQLERRGPVLHCFDGFAVHTAFGSPSRALDVMFQRSGEPCGVSGVMVPL